MVEHDGLMRVFWPTDIRSSDRPGVVVGWRNSTLDVFVVAVLDDVDVRNKPPADAFDAAILTMFTSLATSTYTSNPTVSSVAALIPRVVFTNCVATPLCTYSASRMRQITPW